MRHKVTDQQLRDVVRVRKTKGSAFMLSSPEYETMQVRVKTELEAMTRAEIFSAYPEYTYDLKQ